MIFKRSRLLFAATVIQLASSTAAATTTATATTSRDQEHRASKRRNRRQHLLEDITCTLFHKCVSYESSTDHPNGRHKDSWVCKLPDDLRFYDIVGTSAAVAGISNVISGKSTLTVSEASVDTEKSQLYVPDDAIVRVRTASPHQQAGSIIANNNGIDRDTSAIGTLRTLVIRVFDANNGAPEISVDKLRDDVFNDDAVSLKTQTEACSYNKLKIEPFVGYTPNNRNYVSGGIVDVRTDFDVGGGDSRQIDQVALKAATAQLGDLQDGRFGLVMFCLPPGPWTFMAFAYPSSKYSFYNNLQCSQVTTQMHEVGHNLGLAHSGEFAGDRYDEYGDSTGLMGSSVLRDDARKCYNPQKSYQLGWYADKAATINPLDGIGRLEFKLNGVSDYRRSNDDAFVVLRLKQSSKDKDFYIGYNRAEGINRDTDEDRNMVTIVRKEYGAPDVYSQSTKVAALQPGERFVIPDFDGGINPVQIVFLDEKNGDARIEVVEECKKFTVEVVTDDYPEDTTLSITDSTGALPPRRYKFDQPNTGYKRKICLPMGPSDITYTFSYSDSYGDGLCCGHGEGSYRTFDEDERVVFSHQDEGAWRTKSYDVTVPRSTSPLLSPSLPEASSGPNGACREHVIEVKTDMYPQDTSWKMVRVRERKQIVSYGSEFVAFRSPEYTGKNSKHTTTVCLDEGYEYDFRVYDSHSDGICCGDNEDNRGYYRVIDKCSGKVLVDSGNRDEAFRQKSFTVFPEDSTPGERCFVAETGTNDDNDAPSDDSDDESGRDSRKRRRRKKRKGEKLENIQLL